MTAESDRHDYVPDDDPDARQHAMSSEPPCEVCGRERSASVHN